MTLPYCTRSSVFAWIPAAAFVRAPKTIEAVDASADTLTLRGHGLATGRQVTFAIQASPTPVLGATASALPGGLSASIVRYAIKISEDIFQVSATDGGSAIDLTSAGSGIFGVIVDFGDDLDEQILNASAWINVHLPAHGTPVPAVGGRYPRILEQLAARFAARWMLTGYGLQNPLYKEAAASVEKMGDVDQTTLNGWKAGVPVPWLSLVDNTPNVAEAGARSWSLADRGWSNSANSGDLS